MRYKSWVAAYVPESILATVLEPLQSKLIEISSDAQNCTIARGLLVVLRERVLLSDCALNMLVSFRHAHPFRSQLNVSTVEL